MKVGVIIKTTNGLWTVTRFADEEVLEIFMRMASIQLSDIMLSMDLVQLDPSSPISPPEGFEATFENYQKKKWWCPWCGEVRYFATSLDHPNDFFCTTCHISECDYHIRKINRIDYYEGGTSYNGAGGGKKLARKTRRNRREKLAKRIVIEEN